MKKTPKTLEYYIEHQHVRRMSDAIKAELAEKVPVCAGDPTEQLFWLLHGCTDYPSCKGCAKKLSSVHWEPYLKPEHRIDPDQKQGYRPYCGRSCAFLYGTKTENCRKTCLARYGVSSAAATKEVRDKTNATNMERYGDPFPNRWTGERFLSRIEEKHGTRIVKHIPGVDDAIRKTMEDRGIWTPQEDLDEKEVYVRKVRNLTNANAHLIPNYDPAKRGLCRKTEDNWQVDHRLSISQGWLQGLTPEQLAHPANLCFVPWRENISKSGKCDLTKEELLALIEETETTE